MFNKLKKWHWWLKRDKKVDTCAKLVHKSYELYYARAVGYLLADDKKKENLNDWN